MTFDQVVSRVGNRLNLTSPAALTRIGEEVNERYREVASSIGLGPTIRTTVTASTVVNVQTLTFECEKIWSVFDANNDPPTILFEQTFEEIRFRGHSSGTPDRYAIRSMRASSVTILLYPRPDAVNVLTADAEINLTDLVGAQEPAFATDYHDILLRGVLADELYKMEKYDLSEKQEEKFEKRLGELRLFIAKSANLHLYQGKYNRQEVPFYRAV